jgi:hypothetical protein
LRLQVGCTEPKAQAEADRAVVEIAAGQCYTGSEFEDGSCAPEVFSAGYRAGVIAEEGQVLAAKRPQCQIKRPLAFGEGESRGQGGSSREPGGRAPKPAEREVAVSSEEASLSTGPTRCETDPETAVAAAETQAIFAGGAAVPFLTDHAETQMWQGGEESPLIAWGEAAGRSRPGEGVLHAFDIVE